MVVSEIREKMPDGRIRVTRRLRRTNWVVIRLIAFEYAYAEPKEEDDEGN